MKPLFNDLIMWSQNLSKILLILFALYSFCGCEAKRDVKIGTAAPVFSSTDIRGEPVTLSQLKGRIVVVYFWQNSCCGDSLKLVENIYSASRHKELAIVAVNVGDTKEVVT